MNYKNKNELKQAFYRETGQFWKGYIDTESYVNPYYVEWLENLLIANHPEGESGKESDTVQKKLELYGSMVINVRSLRTFLTQYHPSYTQWIEEIDFILARAAELDKEGR